MSHVFPIAHTLFLLYNRALFLRCPNLSQLGSLPDPSADPHSNYQLHPIPAHELEEATFDCNDLNCGIGAQPTTPPPAVPHMDMRSLDPTQVYKCKGWSTRLLVGLQRKRPIGGAVALRLILGESLVESPLEVMGGHRQGNPKEGVCKVFWVDTLVTLPLSCGIVALQEFNIPQREDHCTLPSRWQISQPNWWDDLAITPTRPWVALEHPLPCLPTPTLYTTKSQVSRLPPPPFHTSPLPTTHSMPTPSRDQNRVPPPPHPTVTWPAVQPDGVHTRRRHCQQPRTSARAASGTHNPAKPAPNSAPPGAHQVRPPPKTTSRPTQVLGTAVC